jgi:CheY-like chemotaxis protein
MSSLLAVHKTRTRFLVVDDDPVVLAIVKERLEVAGHEVTTRQDALGTTQWVAEQHRAA